MSDNAIDARTSMDSLDGQTVQPNAAAGAVSTVPGGPSGPGVLRTTVLLARVTFREAARRKLLWIAAIAGALFLLLFWAGLHAVLKSTAHLPLIARREGVSMMLMMALYAASMLTSMMAALTSCDTLSGEIASGAIHAIATKPVLGLGAR